MNDFPRADAFKTRHIAPLKTKVVYGVAITGRIAGDQAAIVGPDVDSAMRSARRQFGDHISADGAQETVLMSTVQFEELLRLAGITEAS